jgi:hypothetical protein
MNQYFKEYYYWEDYLNGMYDEPNCDEKESLILLAVKLLSNKSDFLLACKNVIENWQIASKINLTNTMCNRRAWLGHAACNFTYNVPEIYTRIAWGMLCELQRNEANMIAEMVIKSFELNYEKQNTELYS